MTEILSSRLAIHVELFMHSSDGVLSSLPKSHFLYYLSFLPDKPNWLQKLIYAVSAHLKRTCHAALKWQKATHPVLSPSHHILSIVCCMNSAGAAFCICNSHLSRFASTCRQRYNMAINSPNSIANFFELAQLKWCVEGLLTGLETVLVGIKEVSPEHEKWSQTANHSFVEDWSSLFQAYAFSRSIHMGSRQLTIAFPHMTLQLRLHYPNRSFLPLFVTCLQGQSPYSPRLSRSWYPQRYCNETAKNSKYFYHRVETIQSKAGKQESCKVLCDGWTTSVAMRLHDATRTRWS